MKTVSYKVDRLSNGATYDFQIRAVNSAGAGEAAEVSVTLPAPEPLPPTATATPTASPAPTPTASPTPSPEAAKPNPPANIIAYPHYGAATLTWESGDADGGTGGRCDTVSYVLALIEVGSPYIAFKTVDHPDVGNPSHSFKWLVAGATYRVEMYAAGSEGCGSYSAKRAVTFTPRDAEPGAAGNPQAYVDSDGRAATIEWVPFLNRNGRWHCLPTKYRLALTPQGGTAGPFVHVPRPAAGTASHRFTGLTPGQRYRVDIRSYGSECGTWSSLNSWLSFDGRQATDIVSGLTAVGGDKEVTLTWDARPRRWEGGSLKSSSTLSSTATPAPASGGASVTRYGKRKAATNTTATTSATYP